VHTSRAAPDESTVEYINHLIAPDESTVADEYINAARAIKQVEASSL